MDSQREPPWRVGGSPTCSPSPCCRASTSGRCIPTRSPRPCGSAARTRASSSTTARCTRVVESLAKAGLIEARETVREGRRPERTVYAITAAGRDEHDEWLSELIATPVREYHSLETALALILGLCRPTKPCGCSASAWSTSRPSSAATDALLRRPGTWGSPEIFMVEEEFRRAMLVAEIEYVERLVTALGEEHAHRRHRWRRVHQLLAEGVTLEEIMRDPVKHLGEEAAMFADLPPASERRNPRPVRQHRPGVQPRAGLTTCPGCTRKSTGGSHRTRRSSRCPHHPARCRPSACARPTPIASTRIPSGPSTGSASRPGAAPCSACSDPTVPASPRP